MCLAVSPRSPVWRRLELVAPGTGRPGVRWKDFLAAGPTGPAVTAERLLGTKLAAAAAAALAAGLASLALPGGPALVLAAAYLAWIAPSIVVAGRASAERALAERASTVLIERLGALVAAGRPPETALAGLLARPTGSRLLDRTATRVNAAYLLGAPLFRTLGSAAREDGLRACAALADDLERARDLGTASAAILRERRTELRQQERSRALEAASTVEGKLMLVLVLCYLPALMLLVVIPLFLSLMRGLGA